jgi:[ribosomal protein S5]-alanine N-acetyltransferase
MVMVAKRKPADVEAAMRTKRLALAPLDPRHAPALFELLNDWDVVKMLSAVPWPLRYEDVESFLASEHLETEDFIIFTASGPIGVMGIKKPGSGEVPRKMPRLGYWLGKPHWGCGYGTEAVGALVDHAFAVYPHDRVGAGVFRENAASQRVLQKLGFTAAGRKTIESHSRGEAVEAIDLQITRAEWEAAKARRQ